MNAEEREKECSRQREEIQQPEEEMAMRKWHRASLGNTGRSSSLESQELGLEQDWKKDTQD